MLNIDAGILSSSVVSVFVWLCFCLAVLCMSAMSCTWNNSQCFRLHSLCVFVPYFELQDRHLENVHYYDVIIYV